MFSRIILKFLRKMIAKIKFLCRTFPKLKLLESGSTGLASL